MARVVRLLSGLWFRSDAVIADECGDVEVVNCIVAIVVGGEASGAEDIDKGEEVMEIDEAVGVVVGGGRTCRERQDLIRLEIGPRGE